MLFWFMNSCFAIQPTLDALEWFEDRLKSISVRFIFRLSEDQITLIIAKHINYEMSGSQADEALDVEIEAMKRVLALVVRTMGHGTWPDSYTSIPVPKLGQNGLVGLYRDEVLRQGWHCRTVGLVSDRLFYANPVNMMSVPVYFTAIRNAFSYKIGPGHHLPDISRWSL
jgi:hypothetical protein